MFQDQRFLVTGGSRGIGRATVQALAEAGADVAFTYRNMRGDAEELCRELQHTGRRIMPIQADAVQLEQAKDTVTKVTEALGGIDGIVINAGINRDSLLHLMKEEDWDDVISTNLKGTYNYARAAIFHLLKQKYGRIVCVSSVSGLMGVPGQVNYSATKAGQLGFVRALSKEVAKRGITVNAVAPGFIETEMWEQIPQKQRDIFVSEIPLERPGSVEEVAHAIQFLLSPLSSYITGSVLVVDGGLSA